MKILHLTTRDTGGSFKACYRLHRALQTLHTASDLLLAYQEHSYTPAQHIHTYQPTDIQWWKRTNFSLRYRWQNYRKHRILRQINQKYEVFSFPQTVYRLHEHPLVQQADILHLHWIADFIDYPSFFKHINKPIVWTLHDQNPFLGGLHYDLDLQRGQDEYLQRLEKQMRSLKRNALSNYDHFHIVATSARMLEDCQKAGIFSPKTQYHLIPCGLDTTKFKDRAQQEARELLGLPTQKPIVLFVAESVENQRKGFVHFNKLMQEFDKQDIHFCIVGKGSDAYTANAPHNITSYSFVEDEEQLALIYASADLLVVPSLQEAFGYTVIEAFACGTPVVAFDCVGAMDKMRQNADLFLARTGNTAELVQKVRYLLENPTILQAWREKVRTLATQEYDQMHNAQCYKRVYNKALGLPIPEIEPKTNPHNNHAPVL